MFPGRAATASRAEVGRSRSHASGLRWGGSYCAMACVGGINYAHPIQLDDLFGGHVLLVRTDTCKVNILVSVHSTDAHNPKLSRAITFFPIVIVLDVERRRELSLSGNRGLTAMLRSDLRE
ncbi:hypothetical protein [Salinibacterium sp. TMP30]|uniref:hypothetical protein n=1 Tax=Salinibacterium sp. TMP30 TaxID=3138237 RepID=UPI0031398163